MSEQEKNIRQLLEKSIKNLRENLDILSMDTFVGKTIETLMHIERDEYLQSLSDAQKDKGNGSYGRALRSLSNNSLAVFVPRTRTGLFSPATLELLKINREKVDEIALSLYKKGMTSEDITSFLQEVFSHNVSPAKISNLSQIFGKFRKAWENSKLESSYKIVFLDVLFVTVRRGNEYAREGVYIASGVREDNRRELLTLSINPTESSFEWGLLLRDLKEKRGVEEVTLFVADGLIGLENEAMKVFPSAKFQKCAVHKMRNILNKVKPKDKKEVSEDMKEVFNNFKEEDTQEYALQKVDTFLCKWKKRYPNLKSFFKKGEIEYYFTYIQFDVRVRRMIYTTNSLENLNRQVRKATKNKLSFESPERLLNYVFMVIKEFEEKNYMRYPVTQYTFFKKDFKKESDTII